MNFCEIAEARQSCRSYNPNRDVEAEKLEKILEVARISPSACNGQPYFISVCKGEAAKKVAKATYGISEITNKIGASEANLFIPIP